MDHLMTCEVCFQQYNKKELLPKVLACGHTYCKTCLQKLFETTKQCPKCKEKIEKDGGTFPTNYSLLAFVTQSDLDKLSKGKLRFQCRALVKMLENCNLKLNADIKNITKGLNEAKVLVNKNDEEMDLIEGKEIISKILSLYKDLNDSPIFGLKSNHYQVSMKLKDFDDTQQYLGVIYRQVQNYQEIFSSAVINGKIVYGKISTHESFLFFHSLDLVEIPVGAITVEFSELKNCILDNTWKSFLRASTDESGTVVTVIIEHYDVQKASSFLKFCTGENGLGFKGCNYSGNGSSGLLSCIILINFDENFRNNHVEYNVYSRGIRACGTNEYFLFVSNHCCWISKVTSNELLCDPVGKIIDPLNLDELISYEDKSALKIIDCGIAFEL